jgi:DNA-binding HxlR family transcriptional regulator
VTPKNDTNPVLSPLRAALDAVGDRWSLLVIAALLEGPRRFGDLQAEVGGIASNILSSRLRALVERGLLSAVPYSERPPRFAYELTDAGRALGEPLRLLAGWGARHRDPQTAPLHEACGNPLEIGWYCPACNEPVGEQAGEEVHYA